MKHGLSLAALAVVVVHSVAACGGTSGTGGADAAGAGGGAGAATGGTAGNDSSGKGGAAGTGGSAAGAGGSTGGTAGKAAAGAAGVPITLPTPCDGAEERVSGSGFMQCDNGLVHRPSAGVCPAYVKTPRVVPPSPLPEEDECTSDADCSAKDYGYCEPGGRPYAGTPYPARCYYACTVDAECDDGSICVCHTDRGYCRASDCVTDADCAPGRFCAEYAHTCGGETGFSCQSAEDQCEVPGDCSTTYVCGVRDGRRYCGYLSCPA